MPKILRLKLEGKENAVEANFLIGDPKPGNHPLKFQITALTNNYNLKLDANQFKMIGDIAELALNRRDSVENILSYISDINQSKVILKEAFDNNSVFELAKKESDKILNQKGN